MQLQTISVGVKTDIDAGMKLEPFAYLVELVATICTAEGVKSLTCIIIIIVSQTRASQG